MGCEPRHSSPRHPDTPNLTLLYVLVTQDNPIFFVGVHCEVEESPLDAELQGVIKKTPVDDMEKQLLQLNKT